MVSVLDSKSITGLEPYLGVVFLGKKNLILMLPLSTWVYKFTGTGKLKCNLKIVLISVEGDPTELLTASLGC